MILLIDNYDSFTYNLVDYFEQLDVEVKVFRNDHNIDEIIKYTYQGVVISPGPEVPKKAGQLYRLLELYENSHPILGICLGHQAIGEYYGAKLVKAGRPMHGKISKLDIRHKNCIFRNIDSELEVVRYNSLIIKDLPTELELLALTNEGEVMAIRHKELPIFGVQFHPEAALTQQGLKILKNWLVYNNIA